MKTYARIDAGYIAELFSTDGDIAEMFAPELIWVDVTEVAPSPNAGWVAQRDEDNWVFSAPPVYVPTAAEIHAANIAVRDDLLARAALAIAPLQDAVDLDDATAAEIALLKQWKQFRVAVSRVPLDARNPAWPVVPDPTYAIAADPNPTS